METTRTELPPATIAAVRATVPMSGLAEFYDTAYTQVSRVASREGWAVTGPAFGWYHGMPTDTVDIAAGFGVTGVEVGTTAGGVEVLEIPGGPALVLIHVGTYDRLADAWGRLEEDRATLDVEGRGDFWEEYVTDPEPGVDAEANLTRIVLPLRA